MAEKQHPYKGRITINPLKEALGMVGAWSDLDFDETIDALDRIRHESKPTPPIKL